MLKNVMKISTMALLAMVNLSQVNAAAAGGAGYAADDAPATSSTVRTQAELIVAAVTKARADGVEKRLVYGLEQMRGVDYSSTADAEKHKQQNVIEVFTPIIQDEALKPMALTSLGQWMQQGIVGAEHILRMWKSTDNLARPVYWRAHPDYIDLQAEEAISKQRIYAIHKDPRTLGLLEFYNVLMRFAIEGSTLAMHWLSGEAYLTSDQSHRLRRGHIFALARQAVRFGRLEELCEYAEAEYAGASYLYGIVLCENTETDEEGNRRKRKARDAMLTEMQTDLRVTDTTPEALGEALYRYKDDPEELVDTYVFWIRMLCNNNDIYALKVDATYRRLRGDIEGGKLQLQRAESLLEANTRTTASGDGATSDTATAAGAGSGAGGSAS